MKLSIQAALLAGEPTEKNYSCLCTKKHYYRNLKNRSIYFYNSDKILSKIENVRNVFKKKVFVIFFYYFLKKHVSKSPKRMKNKTEKITNIFWEIFKNMVFDPKMILPSVRPLVNTKNRKTNRKIFRSLKISDNLENFSLYQHYKKCRHKYWRK